ncbi:SDR family NAD(P)-dependent oxidoreductase [Streptomyces decoyicus]
MSFAGMPNMLDGKVIMVTGASSGIGAAAARLFVERGATVVVMARRQDRLTALVKEIAGAGGRASASAGDVTSVDDVRRAVATAVDTYGRLDGAFNNAGWATAGSLIHETDDSVFDQIVDINLRGVWNCVKYQVPAMLAGGGGSIVNTASTAGLVATGAIAPYVAAKHAVIGLTKAAAAEYGERGIRVNALVVGATLTELMEEVLTATPSLAEPFTSRSLQKRMAAPVEVAEAAAWLCSDASSFVTGAPVPVDGGWTAA